MYCKNVVFKDAVRIRVGGGGVLRNVRFNTEISSNKNRINRYK